MNRRKLSLTLQETIDRMRTGEWELAYDMVPDFREWIQKGKIGHGGEAHTLRRGTFERMKRLGLLKLDREKWPHRIYRWVSKSDED